MHALLGRRLELALVWFGLVAGLYGHTVELAQQVWPEVRPGGLLLLPLGSTEQHGPHLPFDTDTRIAEAVAHGAAAELGCAVAPALAFGASGEHAGFPGTLSMGTDALAMVIVELVRSAALTFDSTVLVNGHGGNHDGSTRAVSQLQDEGHDVQIWWPKIAGGDAHAGRTETSLLLAISPEVVQLELAEPGNAAPLGQIMGDLRAGGVKAVSPNGVLGDPTGASGGEGQALLRTLIDDLIRTCS